jgi:hypothetical protein
MPSLRIPKLYVGAFVGLRDLPEADSKALVQALESTRPTMKVEAVASAISPAVREMDEQELAHLVQALASLTSVRRTNDWSQREVAERVAASEDLAKSDGDEGWQSAFAGRLDETLATTSIRMLGKATDLVTEHDKVFLSSRVVTDLRPIFGDEPDDAPTGVVLAHTLKIEFIHQDGDIGNTYIALDEEDVRILRDDLARADAKASTLKTMLTQMGLSYVGPED